MPGDRAVSGYRAAVAVELRLRGLEYADIAAELGYASKSGAWMAVSRALKARQVKGADVLVGKQLVDLDIMQERLWPRASAGDVAAVGACVRVIEQRCRVLEMVSGGQD